MGHVISIVNRKGGVGKTTTTIALADTLVSEFREDVVILDLDPQASASIALLGKTMALQRSENGLTLSGVLRHARTAGWEAGLDNFLDGQVNRISGRADVALALLPNGEELWDYELENAKSHSTAGMRSGMIAIIAALRERYDYVLVDCPPGQSESSSAVLAVSDLILCPTVPDRLSNWGLSGLERYVDYSLSGASARVFFVATRYRAGLNEHKKYFARLLERDGRAKLLRSDSELVSLARPKDAQGVVLDEDKRYVERLGVRSPKTFGALYGAKASVQLIQLAKAVRRELSTNA